MASPRKTTAKVDRRSTRKTKKLPWSSRLLQYYRAPDFPIVQLAVIALLAGLLLTGIVISIRTFIVGTFFPSTHSRYSVVGPPTIDVPQINRVLAQYHSPASNKGQALYDYGQEYGIDPAFALAFFMHESGFGTQGVAVKTHSLGNIRATAGHPSYNGYRYYDTWEQGFEDWYRLISQQYVSQWDLSTIDQIIPVYAPAADNNNEAAYIQSVKRAVDTWRAGKLVVPAVSG
jgi:Mannosyl-glycoprotein endo-beta-N-acetylglucosaminidase